MHREIGTPVVALVLFAALSAVSFAQTRTYLKITDWDRSAINVE